MGCGPLAGSAAPIAAFVAITQTAGGNGPEPGAARRAGAPAEDGCGAAILLRDAKAREGRRKIAATQPLPARAACRPIALRRPWSRLSGIGPPRDRAVDVGGS